MYIWAADVALTIRSHSRRRKTLEDDEKLTMTHFKINEGYARSSVDEARAAPERCWSNHCGPLAANIYWQFLKPSKSPPIASRIVYLSHIRLEHRSEPLQLTFRSSLLGLTHSTTVNEYTFSGLQKMNLAIEVASPGYDFLLVLTA
ncbi:hypothetical protein EVAR_57181_1 [Eumeta japonica]|uniref:Uncharacterized protein n=1 Tax=Eumeta variegata TaxID=151549 RepID=A0A4C1YYY7_EUMVA|nr:hypothetical protein EVAR_57181_1 [Eumeta japonica]